MDFVGSPIYLNDPLKVGLCSPQLSHFNKPSLRRIIQIAQVNDQGRQRLVHLGKFL